MSFKIGQKIVCIDGKPVRPDCAVGMPVRLVKGAVYTVRSIQQEPHIEGYGVRFEEILNPSMIWDTGEEREWSYDYRRFAPLADLDEAKNAETALTSWKLRDC